MKTYYSMTRMMSWRDSKAAYSWMRLAWFNWFITWISFLTISCERETPFNTHRTVGTDYWEHVWNLVNTKHMHSACEKKPGPWPESLSFFSYCSLNCILFYVFAGTRIGWIGSNMSASSWFPLWSIICYRICSEERPRRSESGTLELSMWQV